jgi:hypothetical protein
MKTGALPNLPSYFLCFAGQLGSGGEYAAETGGEEDLSPLPDATQLEPNLTYLHIFYALQDSWAVVENTQQKQGRRISHSCLMPSSWSLT